MGIMQHTPLRGMAIPYTPIDDIGRAFDERSERLYANHPAGTIAYAFWVSVTAVMALGLLICSVPIAGAILLRHLTRRAKRAR